MHIPFHKLISENIDDLSSAYLLKRVKIAFLIIRFDFHQNTYLLITHIFYTYSTMGNQQVTSVFKEFRKKGERAAMPLTAEALLLDGKLLDPIYTEFLENAYINSSNKDELDGLFRKNIPELKFNDGESHEQ